MDDDGLYEYLGGITPNELCLAMWKSSCSQSFLKGVVAEIAFSRLAKRHQWKYEKIPDLDKKLRYDFVVQILHRTLTFEIKALTSNNSVNFGFKDTRTVLLPSGKPYETKARALAERFDYLGIYLKGFGTKHHFLFMPFIATRGLVDNKLEGKDKEWVEANYLKSSFTLRDLEPNPPHFFTATQLIEKIERRERKLASC